MTISKSSTAKTAAAAKPATKKTTTAAAKTTTVKTAAASKKTAVKPAAAPAEKKPTVRAKAAPRKAAAVAPTPEQRYKMVQDAAYFIAEKNGFVSGTMDYWIAAEAEIAALLDAKK